MARKMKLPTTTRNIPEPTTRSSPNFKIRRTMMHSKFLSYVGGVIVALTMTTTTTPFHPVNAEVLQGCRLTQYTTETDPDGVRKRQRKLEDASGTPISMTQLDVANFNPFQCEKATKENVSIEDSMMRNGPDGPTEMIMEFQLSPDKPPVEVRLTQRKVSVEDNEETGEVVDVISFKGAKCVRTSMKEMWTTEFENLGLISNRAATPPEEEVEPVSSEEHEPNDLDDDFGELNMIAKSNGCVSGSAQMDGSIFHFETVIGDDGSLIMESREIKLVDMPPDDPPELDGEDLEPPEEEYNNGGRFLLRGATANEEEVEDSGRSLTQVPAPGKQIPMNDIDVLVSFTTRMACSLNGVSGDPTRCVLNASQLKRVTDRIALAIEETNTALEASNIIVPGGPKLTLAGTYLVPDTMGWDDTKVTYGNMLDTLVKKDGFMDSVIDKREEVGADITILLVDNQDSCGLAFSGRPVSSSWTYAVVNYVCATGYYSFGHELFHLLGARHDRRVEGCPSSGCCDPSGKRGCSNYGFYDLQNRYRSIMSYNCPIAGGCPRLQMFSTPDAQFKVEPKKDPKTGQQDPARYYVMGRRGETDNASQIKDSWNKVSDYRERKVKQTVKPPEPNPSQSDNGSTGITNSNKFDGRSCGNGICAASAGENFNNCPEDCVGVVYQTKDGRYAKVECGNGICEPMETCENCPLDCASRRVFNENRNFCCAGPPDWRANTPPTDKSFGQMIPCSNSDCQYNRVCSDLRWLPSTSERITYMCGNGVCTRGETVSNCPQDCGCKNNGRCEHFEDMNCRDCQNDAKYKRNNVFPTDTLSVPVRTGKCMKTGSDCFGLRPDPCCGSCVQGKCNGTQL